MERKAHNSLYEAALQVQLGEDFGFEKFVEKGSEKKKKKKKAKASETETVGFGFSAKEVPVRRSKITGRKIRKKKEKIRIVSTDWPHDAGMDIHDGVEESVLEYFSNYFGDNLNEDTSNEDIMNAVYDLIDLTEAVCDVVGLDEYLHHSQVQEPNYNSIDSMFSHESEFRDFPKSYNAKRMKPLGVSKTDFRKTKKKLNHIHSRMKDSYGSDLEGDSLRKQTAIEKGWTRQ